MQDDSRPPPTHTHPLQPGGARLKPAPSPRVRGRQLCLPWLCAVPQHVVCLAESEFPCRDQSGLSSCITELIATSLYRFNEQPSTHKQRLLSCTAGKLLQVRGKKHTLKLGVIRSPLIIYLHLVTIMKMLYLHREESVMASLMKLFCFYSHRLPKPSLVLFLTLPR